MIISASRRTDIPAFFGEWFLNRLRAGEVLVRNPMNARQVTRIGLSPGNVDCIVFWTKNPGPFIPFLSEINAMGHSYYFLFTLTAYDDTIEKGIGKRSRLVSLFRQLSESIGPERVVWRYDPVFFSQDCTVAWHLQRFEELSRELEGYTQRCIISFMTLYAKVKRNMPGILAPEESAAMEVAEGFSGVAADRGMLLSACSQEHDLGKFGIRQASCIDRRLIESIIGKPVKGGKDKSQRPRCGCIASRDIGSYDTCRHGCIYCYANRDTSSVQERLALYDPHSPLLCDRLRGDERITGLTRDDMGRS